MVREVTDERDALLAFLAEQRDGVANALRGLTDEQAASMPSASELSLGALVKHLTACERRWVVVSIAGRVDPDLWPVKDWGAEFQLTPDDTVVTFNWDLTLESIARFGTLPVSTNAASLAKKTPIGLTAKSFEPETEGTARVLKLHGSVDWKRQANTYERTADPLFALDCQSDEIAIATPGPAKQSATESFLEKSWGLAKAAITQAGAVVFIGYRFPPSDSLAREALLTALSVPREVRALRTIHTILGPSVQSESSARLGGLISGMLDGAGWRTMTSPSSGDAPRYRLQQLPLYGQDFMSVFSRQQLFAPPSEVTIKFDAPIEKAFAKLEVLGADGKPETIGQPQVDPSALSLSVKVGALKPGDYTVKWGVVCVDSHHTQGSYIFTVAGGG